ncbi:glycosyltransferase [Candidatus Pacearchaeota archaeon]|nr:glycosyltransferase [Candidatus Pacearchaeota archaeon]
MHDYFENAEGGGRLSLLLAKEFEADLVYGFKSSNHPFSSEFPSPINQFPLCKNITIPLLRQFVLSRAFLHKTSFLARYDRVIYSGSYAPLAVKKTLHKALNIYYCHTPPRFIYDQKEFYLSRVSLFFRPVLKWFINYMQPHYEDAVAKMDVIVTNSENVRKRIQKFLGHDSIVVHPPCDVDRYSWFGCEGYYLSTARLDPLKRVDLVIEAFLEMPDKKLIVTSGGQELSRLRKLAKGHDNIIFTGWVAEDQLLELIGNSIATIYLPKDEDFGLSPVESMAAGKAVIGVADGGLCETVLNGKTGVLISSPPRVGHIVDAVERMSAQKAQSMRCACENHADTFRKEIFLNKMGEIVGL